MSGEKNQAITLALLRLQQFSTVSQIPWLWFEIG